MFAALANDCERIVQEKVGKFRDERDVLLSKWTILSQAFAKAANID